MAIKIKLHIIRAIQICVFNYMMWSFVERGRCAIFVHLQMGFRVIKGLNGIIEKFTSEQCGKMF